MRAVEADPSDTGALKKLLRHYYEKGEWELVDVYAAMLPADPEAALWRALSLQRQDLPEMALSVLEKVDTLAIDNRELLFEVLLERGRLMLKAQRAGEALHHFDEALRLQPDSHRAHTMLGTCLLVQNDPAAAGPHFQQALRREPDYVDALFGMGLVRHAGKQYEESEACFQQIMEAEPEHMKSLNTMLRLAYESRRFAAVERQLQRYLGAHPENLNMRFVLAGVLFEQMKLPEAAEAVERVLHQDPDYRGAAELRERIAGHMNN